MNSRLIGATDGADDQLVEMERIAASRAWTAVRIFTRVAPSGLRM